MKRFCSLLAIVCLSLSMARAEPVKLTIPTLPSPSLGAFMGPVIKSQKFDEQNGLDLTFVQKPTATYRTDFAAGTDQLGGSGTLLADVALLKVKGVDVVYLFNVFDFWATVVVPKNSSINALVDLKGKTLAASLPTASFAMFRYLAKLGGLDMDTVQLRNSDSAGLVPIAKSGRTDAVQLWEPSYSILVHGNSDFKKIDVMSGWRKSTGLSAFPYLGIAAHREWVEKNKPVIGKLYATYKKAAAFVKSNPKQAAAAISKDLGIPDAVTLDLVSSDRLQLNMYWADENKKAASKIFEAAQDIGYLSATPGEGVLYGSGE